MIHLKRSFTIALVLLFATINLSLAEDAPMEKVSKLPFGGWYEKVDYDVNPSIKGYTLPLKADQLRPFENDLTFVRSSSSDIALQSYGFMVSEGYRSDNLSHYYKGLRDNKVPMFVTTDTVQHMYHVLFDKSLADLEEKVFYDDLLVILDELLDDMGGYKCGPMPDAMPKKLPKDAVLSDYAVATAEKFLKVSIALLKEDHGYSDPDVLAELKNISAHAGFSPSPVFGYDEDYSQYIPRGHYTKTDKLKRYFKSMMWLGRLTFLAKGKRFEGDDALISHRRAAVQTTAAALIAEHMRKNPSFPKYDALYNATAFFVGYSDDLTPYEYSKAIADLNEAQADVLNIARNDKLFMKLQRELLKFRPPAIYSGTGNITTYDPEALKGEPKPEILQKALASTMGMRFMGQRFVIDSYVMGRLCFPTVNEFSGNGAPFTGAPKRFRSTALDFMALLGSPEAYEILKEQQMTAYKGYGEEFAKLKKEMAALSTEDWHRNLYLGQLDAMKSLFSRTADGYQPFQRTKQWEKRQLQTVLGGWTALRHDTILYVKQPYGLRAGAAPPPKPKAVGYVEPEPEYYARMLSNVRQLKRGLAELGLADRMPASVRSRTDKLEWFIETLMDISIAELEQKEMRKEHVSFLESIADYISGIQGKDPKEFTSEIVADVFTDGTKGVVVEEGTGKFNSLVVAWHKPDGTIEVAIGPVYSYYEFTMPMNQRLTDEKWQQMLKNNPPERPDWIRSFTPVPGPLPEERF